MLTDFAYIGLFIVVSAVVAGVAIGIPFLLSLYNRLDENSPLRQKMPNIVVSLAKMVPHNPSKVKGETFECGMPTIGSAWVQFNFRYYYYALIFLILDVLAVFLIPWAIGLKGFGYKGLAAAMVLVVIVVVGYIYAWKKKALEWK